MATLPHDPLWPRAGAWPQFDPPRHHDDHKPYDAVIVGVPTHKTSISQTSAHRTPDAVRAALARYSDHLVVPARTGRAASWRTRAEQRVLSEVLRIADAGNIAEPDDNETLATERIAEIAQQARLVIALGGDNSLTVPVAEGACGYSRETAGVITLDAHHDLRDGKNNGSPIRRLVESGFAGERIVQIGISDFANSQPYGDRAAEYGITVIHRDEIEARPLVNIAARALEIAGRAGGPIHIDFDVDVCDRAAVPACPASLPGGISAFQLRKFVRVLARNPRVASIDFAEVDADSDASDERTVRLVALCVLEALAGLTDRLG
jgi:formiminoglutamase